MSSSYAEFSPSNLSGVPDYTIQALRQPRFELALVIPVINESSRLLKQLRQIQNCGPKVDVIIADGGSTDGSTSVTHLRSLGVSTLLTKTDKGRLSAQLRMAFHYTLHMGYQGVITMDGNNKDSCDGIERIADALRQGYDFVQGSRFIAGGQAINTPKIRYASIRLIHAPITNLAADYSYTDTTNGFRGHSRRFLEDHRVAPLREIFDSYELLAYLSIRAVKLGFQVNEVPVTRAYPDKGELPTKIHGVKAYGSLITALIKAKCGKYDPPRLRHAV